MSTGTVYIVGAGPGCADLLTIRAIRAIRKSKVLICDGLLPKTFLDDVDISLNDKRIEWLENNDSRKSQDEINKLMLDMARQGKNVARIKTGDPHVFGRGMEELIFLSKNEIACEVIPGVTVSTAGTGLVDLALTRRGQSSSFAVVTGRCEGGKLNTSFPKADSLIIFMGISILDEVVNNLISNGWAKNCPAAILERVSMPWQNQVAGTLKDISELGKDACLQAPAILVVGKAAEDNKLSQYRPRILFTGLDPSNFRTMGTILHWPAVEVIRDKRECEKLPKIIEQLRNGHFGYAIFTSKSSVRIFFEGLKDLGGDSRVFHSAKVISCGQGTAMLLEENGIVADHTPAGMGSEAILESAESLGRANVLLVQSATATEALANAMASKLGKVERMSLHRVQGHPELGRKLPDHDVIYFTCPSGVRAYWEKYGKDAFQKEVWCIGDVTAKQVNELNIKAKVV